jgi:DNA-binding MarR family transcriptional regulator/N-acetylglutamate synthase-like GNAT family acetyltransferase
VAIATADAQREQRIDQMRRFNRFYTRTIGVLQDGYLHSSFSLTEVRVLYELAHRARASATELARELALDAGYLSRMLNGFASRGLLDRTKSVRDGRETVLALSEEGRATFVPLEANARAEIGALLARLPERQQHMVVGAMRTIEGLLGEPAPDDAAYVLRQHQAGDMGWVVERHGALYAQEYGFDAQFEALVASIVARFLQHFEPRHERCWIAERAGQRVGCVFLVRASQRVGKLRLFLVEPEARGAGIGRALVDDCLRFARAAGYRKVRLWTQSNLLAARHVYASAGFAQTAAEPHHSFSQDLVAETWELTL